MFFLKVIETFQRHAVEYAVSGGYAAALHGYVQNIKEIDFVTENTLLGFIEVHAALADCGLRPEKYSAHSIFKLRGIESTWAFIGEPNEKVIINTSLNSNDCKTECKSVYGNKIPVLTIYELQKKLNFQIAERKLWNEKSFSLRPIEILQILEDYRNLNENAKAPAKDKSILISLKVPQSLLEKFKEECSGNDIKYQTQIKKLMKDWLA